MERDPRRLGERIAELREERGLKQATLARMAGVPAGSLSHWELGERRVPADAVPAIANALGVTICQLYGVEEGHTTAERAPREPRGAIAERVAARLAAAWEELPESEQTFLTEISESAERFRQRLLAEEGVSSGSH